MRQKLVFPSSPWPSGLGWSLPKVLGRVRGAAKGQCGLGPALPRSGPHPSSPSSCVPARGPGPEVHIEKRSVAPAHRRRPRACDADGRWPHGRLGDGLIWRGRASASALLQENWRGLYLSSRLSLDIEYFVPTLLLVIPIISLVILTVMRQYNHNIVGRERG